jgi:uncharacterized membrane protein
MTIRNPLEWGADSLNLANKAVEATSHSVGHTREHLDAPMPTIRKIGIADLRDALALGLNDLAACRTDVFFIAAVYPVVGLFLARLLFGYDMLPLLFPIASGFALLGPLAAVGLYELSRRRERGEEVGWLEALQIVRSPSFGAIVVLGLFLLVIFLVWLATAQAIYNLTLGPDLPESLSGFAHDVMETGLGHTMIFVGIGVGFLYALLVLSISAVSFPLLLDRDVGLVVAIATSIRAMLDNPVPMAAWGLIVAGGLLLGSLPLFLGLIFVMPVLGHATWHLYRKVVVR